jgi:hypothetical protein
MWYVRKEFLTVGVFRTLSSIKKTGDKNLMTSSAGLFKWEGKRCFILFLLEMKLFL